MIQETDEKVERNVKVRGSWLIGAYFTFLILTLFFTQIFGFEEAFKGPQVIFVTGINYIPLILIPFFLARLTSNRIDFLGIGSKDFLRTLPIGIVAFFFAGIWQSGFLEIKDILSYPDWTEYIYIAAFPIIALILPLAEIKICSRLKITPGLATLLAWGIFSYYFPTGDDTAAETIFAAAQNPVTYFMISFCIGIIVPFAEEYFFRGFVLKHFLEKNSKYVAALLTGFLFGFAHIGAPTVLTLILFGIPLGIMTAYSRSIYPAIWAHAGLNLAGMVQIITILLSNPYSLIKFVLPIGQWFKNII